MTTTHDLRITGFQPLMSPASLRSDAPLGEERAALVQDSRAAVRRVLTGADDRLLVVVGPCSVHDPAAALDYAHRLATAIEPLRDDLVVVMRVYFEKPRTTLGWKGLINDPDMNGTYDVQRGLQIGRRVLLDVLDAGLPTACEFLEPTSPQYIADTVTWGAIGARTPESQVHRQLASGLSMPVGFKNATDGDVQTAIDGCTTAAGSHVFFGIDEAGQAAVVSTSGNPDCHIVLRGGRGGPNYGPRRPRRARVAREGRNAAAAGDRRESRQQRQGPHPAGRRRPRNRCADRSGRGRASPASCWRATSSPAGRNRASGDAWSTGRASPMRVSAGTIRRRS